MHIMIFMGGLLLVALVLNRYYTANNKKKFAEAEERLKKENDE